MVILRVMVKQMFNVPMQGSNYYTLLQFCMINLSIFRHLPITSPFYVIGRLTLALLISAVYIVYNYLPWLSHLLIILIMLLCCFQLPFPLK